MPTLPPGQVGAIPADVLAAHSQRTGPTTGRDFDLDGTEYAGTSAAPVGVFGSSLRAVRAYTVPPTPAIHDQPASPALTAGSDARAWAHGDRGQPNPRQTDSVERGNAYGEVGREAMPVLYQNDAFVQRVVPEAPPQRARAGWTGEDNTRPSIGRRPVVSRPFDQAIAQHPGALTKMPQPEPLARHSYRLGAIESPRPYAGGGTGTVKAPTVEQHPNTFRVLPDAWDRLLVNTGGPASTAATPDPAVAAVQSRGRSFR